MTETCPFCRVPQDDIVMKNHLAFAMYDSYPVSEGHILIIPFRHIESFFDAESEEIHQMNGLMSRCHQMLCKRLNPDGFNIGTNIGRCAGQTIFHLHMHLIPRYQNDHPDPRGGIRHILPGKGYY